jgi:glycerol kinase
VGPTVILAIDQGTTGSTCLVVDPEGRIRGRAQAEITQHFPAPGLVEHDPDEILEVTFGLAREALREAGIEGPDLDAIGITNQRETVVAWDRETGRALHRALVWQDGRGAERCRRLTAGGFGDLVRERTGLLVDPYFSATKIEWLLGNLDQPERAAFGTIDSWLVHNLCGRHVTDPSNASRTMLFDIGRMEWDPELCGEFGVDPDSLPEVLPSAGDFGVTTEFGGEVPVTGVAGDQQAALFGQACLEPGSVKNTYGTGCFVLMNAGSEVPDPSAGTISTVAWDLGEGPIYAAEAPIFIAGAGVQWLRDGLGLIGDAAESEAIAGSLDSNDGVYFVPALTGLGSPWWDPEARGTVVGLTRGTGRAHLVRATLEAIAYQSVDAVRAQEEATGRRIEALRVDGGAVANQWLMQFQADLLGVPVMAPASVETTGTGAAALAAVGAGLATPGRLADRWQAESTWEPSMSRDEAGSLLSGWHAALSACRGHASPDRTD